ncbi:UvrD/REP helicase [Paludibacter propionicigenes WB4]|uniref:DNA 3'-5' helicase n=1 Tax=Paludibacter propionicigenes (strain DSM 17365 / JCM 13257 / WB4) TaxID=694427 RepID=E4T594_PALPW|nr:UvrD-helicase domain-containing protein [Paludibacter propionicigenes]ADQ79888.1 UvrD/REP helicase [Paludibacter propionicigenes WB4]
MLNIYRASAGSGKTYRLTQDYIHLLFDARRERTHRRILAVTFTNKATDEMKTRILKELLALSQGEKSDYRAGLISKDYPTDEGVNAKAKKILTGILHDYSSFSISTIDRFFQQVIRSFARDIGVHGGYNLELDNTATLEQSVDNLFLDLSKDENKQLLQWLTAYAEERIEQSESWNMRNNIMELGREIFKESYQHKAEDTNRKLHEREFLTNYRKSLREIKTTFEAKVKQTATDGLNIMARNGLTHDDFAYKTTTTLEKLVKGKLEISARFTGFADDVTNCYTKSKPQEVKSAIESAYSNGLGKCFQQIVELLNVGIVEYNSALMVLKHINTLGILSDLAVQIKKLTDEQNTMLISDSNMLLNKIIDNSDTPFVYEKTGITIDNFMIDEFQDTSTLQWKNFHPLMANSLSAGKFNLVVGDVKQSIYRWRNSDWKLLDEQILNDFRPEQIHEENLETNWRSDKNIIDFNNSFFRRAASLLQSKLNENLEAVLPVYPSLEALKHKIEHAYANIHQQTSPKAGTGSVQINFIDSDENEAGWKAESLQRLPAMLEDLQSRGYRPADICILVRKNDEEQQVIHRLLSYKTTAEAKPGFCYDIMGNEGLLIGAAASVRFVLGILQLFVNPADSIQRTIVNYEYARGRQHKSENEALNACFVTENSNENILSALFSDEENERLKQVQHSSLFDMVEQIISLFGIGSWHNEAVFVQAFQDVVFRYTTGKTADLNSFLTWWKKNGGKQCISTPDNQNAMRIMTVHKSKGLDFKVVIMPFCDWDLDSRMRNILWCEPTVAPFNELPLLPIEYGSKLGKSIFAENYFDEQMHLFIDSLNIVYVAFTRAKNELICMAPAPKKELESLSNINSLSALLTTCFTVETPGLDNEIIPLSKFYDGTTKVFSLGEPTQAAYNDAKGADNNEKINSYPSVSSTDRLRIRHQSLDYLLENQQLTDSRLNYGLIMHDILRNITHKADQQKAILSMIREGRISESEAETVEVEMEKFWNLPQTNDWFATDTRVLNEITILTPRGEQYRPDRVVINGNKATIVDYKFGDKESKTYIQQVKQYMNLIAEMGYQTNGFVCYVSLGKIETV